MFYDHTKSHAQQGLIANQNALWSAEPDFAEIQLARGNCFLELRSMPQSGARLSCVVYAMKKFTGGLGDDDDRETGDDFVWKLYFKKSVDEATSVVCTKKINGEAAHFSARLIDGQIYLCAGSKNVHMLLRDRADLDLYDKDAFRYSIAREIANCLLDKLDDMTADIKRLFLEFLCVTRFTGVAEILHPAHPHVEDLSYLNKPELKFITWSSTDLESTSNYLTALPPDVSIQIARLFGLATVDYDIINIGHLDERMNQIRSSYGDEGEVLCFLDDHRYLIGMLKKKSVWYIVVRAIREKARAMCAHYSKSPTTSDLSANIKRVEKRLDEIQKWLSLSDDTTVAWKKLGTDFSRWSYNKLETGELNSECLNVRFPVFWKQFLLETSLTDHIPAIISTTTT